MEAMEAKLSETGCCIELLVPLAQGLAKQPLTSVPVRYVRPELELQFTSNTCSSRLPQAPVIDMIKLLSSDCHVSELHKLDYACKHWGFFQVCHLLLQFHVHEFSWVLITLPITLLVSKRGQRPNKRNYTIKRGLEQPNSSLCNAPINPQVAYAAFGRHWFEVD
ncbi:thebaine 6-O-demethylase-like isoform X1 [Prosopis cineraria]|uniref:thebaine 6-O-demethylase-like isoform X1 n=1 Tax=Prosopis cineraria TaxID=364024 RepID=UPI0024105A29|nr:thebaine 6-O-demethylase-like isoform X1 [Prosopis cineraria]XP_054793537.1 thebaine 6-O-demethylase-like isoform X1 [Prosopis cineraria]